MGRGWQAAEHETQAAPAPARPRSSPASSRNAAAAGRQPRPPRYSTLSCGRASAASGHESSRLCDSPSACSRVSGASAWLRRGTRREEGRRAEHGRQSARRLQQATQAPGARVQQGGRGAGGWGAAPEGALDGPLLQSAKRVVIQVEGLEEESTRPKLTCADRAGQRRPAAVAKHQQRGAQNSQQAGAGGSPLEVPLPAGWSAATPRGAAGQTSSQSGTAGGCTGGGRRGTGA